MITIVVESGRLRNQLAELGKLHGRMRTILQASARAVRSVLQQHFKARDQQPNRLGGKRTHFWLDIYKSTQIAEVTNTYATVAVGDSRLNLKIHGGTIVPKNAKWLAIPAIPEAHGRRPQVFQSQTGIPLRFIPLTAQHAELREAEHFKIHRIQKQTKKRKAVMSVEERGGRTIYFLRKRVTQDKDPQALPDSARMQSAALAAAEQQLTTEIERVQRA